MAKNFCRCLSVIFACYSLGPSILSATASLDTEIECTLVRAQVSSITNVAVNVLEMLNSKRITDANEYLQSFLQNFDGADHTLVSEIANTYFLAKNEDEKLSLAAQLVKLEVMSYASDASTHLKRTKNNTIDWLGFCCAENDMQTIIDRNFPKQYRRIAKTFFDAYPDNKM